MEQSEKERLVNFYLSEEKYKIVSSMAHGLYGHGGIKKLFNQLVDDYIVKFQQSKKPQVTLISFDKVVPPPRISEDFNHIIRPYMKNTTKEEIIQLMDTGYKMYKFGHYLTLALKHKWLNDETRLKANITLEEADVGLGEISHIFNEGVFSKRDLERLPGDI